MADIFAKTRKQGTFVFSTGVECAIQSLMGVHQRWITNSNEKKRLQGFIDLMKDCIVSIGDDKDITEDKVEQLLSIDRKQLLVEIRQLSTNKNPSFEFEYQFPATTGEKKVQHYDILFTEEDFPLKPYPWVRNPMFEDYKVKHEIDRDLTKEEKRLALLEPLPIIYTNYKDVLQQVTRNTKLPESGVQIEWIMLDGITENQFGQRLKANDISSHTMLEMRKGKYFDKVGEKKEPVPIKLPLDRLSLVDIEHFRGDVIKTEGSLDTSLAIQYKEESLHAELDLITTAAFFFPSLAI